MMMVLAFTAASGFVGLGRYCKAKGGIVKGSKGTGFRCFGLTAPPELVAGAS